MTELLGAALLAGIAWCARRVRLRIHRRCSPRGTPRWEIKLDYDPVGFRPITRNDDADDDRP